MDDRANAVFGIYRTRKRAGKAVNALKKSGILAEHISLRHSYTPPSPVDAAHWGGGIAGAVIGGSMGMAAGLGVWALPMAEIIILGGPVTGTLLGGLLGAWGGHAVLDSKNKESEETFITVRPDSPDEVHKAILVFEDSGADDVFIEEKPIRDAENDILQFQL